MKLTQVCSDSLIVSKCGQKQLQRVRLFAADRQIYDYAFNLLYSRRMYFLPVQYLTSRKNLATNPGWQKWRELPRSLTRSIGRLRGDNSHASEKQTLDTTAQTGGRQATTNFFFLSLNLSAQSPSNQLQANSTLLATFDNSTRFWTTIGFWM